MIIPTRLKKIAQIADCGSSRYTLENVHIRKRNGNTELTATDAKCLLRFIVPADGSTVDDCETQVDKKVFKKIVGASGTAYHRISDQPNGVVNFTRYSRDGSEGCTVHANTNCAGRYPNADLVLDKPSDKVYIKHRLNAELLRRLLDAVVTSGADVIDVVTAGDRDPVYIDGVATGKHDDSTVQFHGILMPCTTD